MKKKSFAAIMIGMMCVIFMAGCGSDSAGTDPDPKSDSVSESGQENSAPENENEDSPKTDEKPEADLSSEEGIRTYLAGDWALLDRKTGEDYGILSVGSDGSFEFARISDSAKGNGTISFGNMQTKKGEAPDGFSIEFEDCGKLVPESDQFYGAMGTGGIFHTGTFGDEDYLYLKEIGNGDSVFSMYAFNTNKDSDEIGAWSYDWLFYRKSEGENTAKATVDETFYAWAWELDDDGNGVWLQPMNVHEFETYDEYSNRKFLGGYFTETDDIRIAHYNLTGRSDLDDLVNTSDWDSGFPLMMCEVTTDDKGNIKELKDVDIAMYNIYDMGELDPDYSYEGTTFTINGADIDMRDHVALTDSIIDCMRVGEWIIVECHVNPYKSVYEFYNIPNGDMGYFEYEIAGTQLTWRGDDLSTAVYVCGNGIYDFWGNMIGYVEEGVIGRIDITDNKISAHISVTDDIGRMKEYVKDYEYEPCDSAVLSYYEYILVGPRAWRRLKDKAGDATALVIVNPPEKMLEKMPYPLDFVEGALDKVAVVPLVDDAKITIESTASGDRKKQETEKMNKGRAAVFPVTVSEAMPTARITVKAPGHEEAVWDVVQISGRIPQRSIFIK